MYDLLKSLAELLTRPRLTSADVVGALGVLRKDLKTTLIIIPDSAWLREASIVREHDSDEPAYINLQLADPPTLNQMAAVFGAYQTPPRLPDSGGRMAMFDDIAVSTTHTATLIASVDSEDTVPSLIIQRNPRLDD